MFGKFQIVNWNFGEKRTNIHLPGFEHEISRERGNKVLPQGQVCFLLFVDVSK